MNIKKIAEVRVLRLQRRGKERKTERTVTR